MRRGAVALSLALAACATAPPTPTPAADALPLLAPAALGPPRQAQQLMRAAFAEHEVTLQCGLVLSAEQLRLACVNPLGMRVLTLAYDGHTLTASTLPGVPAQIDAARVLADVELAFAPLAAWQAQLAQTAWRVSEPTPSTRRLHRAGRLVAEVHYAGDDPWQGRLWVSNLAFGYTLAVEMLP